MTAGRVLITGATGFVGRALATHLAGTGRALTLASRQGAAPFGDGPVRHVAIGEIGPVTDWRVALRDAGSIVHLAGLAHAADAGSDAGSDGYDLVNRAGTIRLYEEAARSGAARFVFVSSVTVLGDATDGVPLDDRSRPNPRTVYARSKLAAEEALAERARAGGPALTILRPPLVCGPGVKGNLAALLRVLDTPLPLPLAGLRNRRTLLALDNLVAAIAAVLAAPPAPGAAAYVLGDPEPVSMTGIAEALREGLGRPRRLLPAPTRLLRGGAAAIGKAGVARRLLGDLEADGAGFRRAFGWSDVTDSRAGLVAAGRAWRERRADGASPEGGRTPASDELAR